MKKCYYLSTCSTSKRIIKEYKLEEQGFDFQDIKTEAITEEQLDAMKHLAGSYEALFSRIARKYKEYSLKEKNLNEDDYKSYILDEYTFLKRPVILFNDQIFIGSGKPNLEQLGRALNG